MFGGGDARRRRRGFQPGGAKMRRQQRIDPQLRIAVEATFDRQHIAPCIRSGAQAH